MLLTSGKNITHLNPMFPPKRFPIFSLLLGRCLERLDAFIFFLKRVDVVRMWIFTSTSAPLSLSQNITALASKGYDSTVTSAPLPKGRNTTAIFTSYELFPHFSAPGLVSSQFPQEVSGKNWFENTFTKPYSPHAYIYTSIVQKQSPYRHTTTCKTSYYYYSYLECPVCCVTNKCFLQDRRKFVGA